MHITENTYLVGLLMTSLTTMFYSVKSAPEKGFKKIRLWIRMKFVYTVRIYQYDELFYILEAWLFRKHEEQYKDVEASVDWGFEDDSRIPPGLEEEGRDSHHRRVYYKQEENTFFVSFQGKRFAIEKTSEKDESHSKTAKDRYFRKYTLTGYRCKRQVNAFLEGVFAEHEAAKPKGLVRVLVSNIYGDWNTFDELRVRSLDRVILPQEQKAFLIQDLEEFQSSEDWYIKAGVPYKRGYCFHGAPGNGKTTLTMAIAGHVNRDLYILNINALSDDAALQRAFSNLKRNSVLVIEDVDKSFVKRQGVQDKVSFSCFLNVLDGAMARHGLIVILTTNHIDHLDPALLRDGRMDVKLEIKNPGNKCISDYLSLFYQQSLTLEGDTENEKVCMATVQEICIRNRMDSWDALAEITSRINEEISQDNLVNSD